jgi:hypothetical protein
MAQSGSLRSTWHGLLGRQYVISPYPEVMNQPDLWAKHKWAPDASLHGNFI